MKGGASGQQPKKPDDQWQVVASKEEELRKRQLQSEKRKKARAEALKQSVKQDLMNDPQFKKDQAQISQAQNIAAQTKKELQKDAMSQKDSLHQRLLERKKRIAKNKANKSLLVLDTASDNQGRDPRAGAQSVLVGQTPNFTTPEQDIHHLLAKFQNLGAVQNLESGDPVVVEEDDDDDIPAGHNTSTLPGSTSTGNLGRISAGNPKNQNQSVILKSNNPIHLHPLDNSGFQYNFDAHSKSSAYFMNEDEIQEYEEKMQKKIQEVWASMDQKTEILQKEYQD